MQPVVYSFANISIISFDLRDCLNHEPIQHFLFLLLCQFFALFYAIAVGYCIDVAWRIAVFFISYAVISRGGLKCL